MSNTTFNPAVSLTLAAYDSFNDSVRNKNEAKPRHWSTLAAGTMTYAALAVVALVETVARGALAVVVFPALLVDWLFDLVPETDRNHWFNKYVVDPIAAGYVTSSLSIGLMCKAMYENFVEETMPNSVDLFNDTFDVDDDSLLLSVIEQYGPSSAYVPTQSTAGVSTDEAPKSSQLHQDSPIIGALGVAAAASASSSRSTISEGELARAAAALVANASAALSSSSSSGVSGSGGGTELTPASAVAASASSSSSEAAPAVAAAAPGSVK